jgi:hypothetical protein
MGRQVSKSWAASITIPTNPDYDPEHDPSLQAELANPVRVNNSQILFTNALLAVTQEHIELLDDVIKIKLELKDARRQREKLVRQVLREHPPSSGNDTKTLKLIEAYVARIAFGKPIEQLLDSLEVTIEELEDDLERKQDEIKQCELKVFAIRQASQNSMTFLSYVKADANAHGFTRPSNRTQR